MVKVLVFIPLLAREKNARMLCIELCSLQTFMLVDIKHEMEGKILPVSIKL